MNHASNPYPTNIKINPIESLFLNKQYILEEHFKIANKYISCKIVKKNVNPIHNKTIESFKKLSIIFAVK